MIRLLTCLLFLAFAPGAHATPIVADISNYRINIDSYFNGTRLFLFGARNDPGDVVVVVRGPLKNYIVRKKEEMLGVWVNRDRMKLFSIPDFYAVASNKPLKEIASQELLEQLGIGEELLLHASGNDLQKVRYNGFASAFFTHQHKLKLYAGAPRALEFMGETLFKTTVDFPDNIPPGNYTAEIYLLSDGMLSGMQSIPVTVVKSGLDAVLYDYAHNRPFFYGFSAIVIALSIGWLAGRLMERFC